MIQIFRTEDGVVHQKDERLPGSWIALTNPTATEILEISDAYQIDPDHLRAPLDEEERSRIEVEDNYTLVLVDIPAIEELVCDDPSGYCDDLGFTDYGLPGRNAGALRVYGRTGQGFPHFYENPFYFTDFV